MTLDLAIDYQILTAPKAGTRQKIKELNFIKIKKKNVLLMMPTGK